MRNIEEKKRKIIDQLSWRINFCVTDCNTYLFAKTIPVADKYAAKGLIGGGNFVILLATLACFDLLSYVNFLVEAKKEELWTDEKITNLREEKKGLSDDMKKLVRLPKVGEPNNTFLDRLKNLLKETLHIHQMTDKQIEKFVTIRNKMAHVFNPKIFPAAAMPFLPNVDFISLLVSYRHQPVFALTTKNTLGIDSNALNQKLSSILLYLIEKIQSISQKDKDRIDTVIGWFEEN